MRSLLVVCQMRADPIDHYQYQCAISHIQPIAPSDKLAGSVSCKRAIGVGTKVWFVKAFMTGPVRLLAARCSTTLAKSILEVTLIKRLAGKRHQHAAAKGVCPVTVERSHGSATIIITPALCRLCHREQRI
jgi:hypothetical protein